VRLRLVIDGEGSPQTSRTGQWTGWAAGWSCREPAVQGEVALVGLV
jgi:hypothetical protein